MQGSLLGCSSGKFKGFSDQVLFAPILLYFLIAATMSSCGFVDDAGEGVNTPPSVSVQTGDLIVNEQSPVTLNSSVTDDFASVDSISWQQTTGPEVQLRDADSEQASFTSPAVLVHESPLRLQFRIVVRDNFGQEGNDSIVVLVNADNILPVANDDSGLVVNEGQPGEPAAVINVTPNDSDEYGRDAARVGPGGPKR
jgi:hypothetical protein